MIGYILINDSLFGGSVFENDSYIVKNFELCLSIVYSEIKLVFLFFCLLDVYLFFCDIIVLIFLFMVDYSNIYLYCYMVIWKIVIYD